MAEKKRGGPRPGSGRKPQDGVTKKKSILVRLNESQEAGIRRYVDALNERRIAAGAEALPVATWVRDVILKASENDELRDSRVAARKAAAGNELL